MTTSSVSYDLPRAGSPRLVSKQAVRLVLYSQLLLLDALAVASGFLIAAHMNGGNWVSPQGINLAYFVVPTYLFFATDHHAYGISVLHSLEKSVRRALVALAITTLFILLASFFMYARPVASRTSVAVGIALTGVMLALFRIAFHRLVVRAHAGQLVNELLIIDNVPFTTAASTNVLDARQAQIEPDLQNPVMLNRLAMCLQGADRVIIACPPERQQAWSLLLKGSNIRGELLLPQASTIGAIGLDRYGDAETLVVSHGPLSLRSRAQKRALDLLITVPVLILLTPLMLLVALAIKLESPGPVFFKQNRIGRSNSAFSILKFRSMRTELCDAAGNRSASRDDDRITRVGALIRRTSIDELPQLINVLRGDMSLVGPRPHALGSLAGDKLFWEVDEQYWIRHALKPGITGLAQVRGYRGATLQREDLQNRLRSDLEYVNGWSLWLDIVILFATTKVLRHQNAY